MEENLEKKMSKQYSKTLLKIDIDGSSYQDSTNPSNPKNLYSEEEENIEIIQSGDNIIENNKLIQNENLIENDNIISYKDELLKGNFMPALIMLDNKKININDEINEQTGDTLLHYAVMFSILNVTRCLIEKFNADPNKKNKAGMTPLHLICSNKKKHIFLFIYYINIPNVNIDEEDNLGLTSLGYSVINNFNLAFIFLISKKADLSHKDKFGNNIIYFALVNNNLFIINFIYTHCSEIGINVNSTFYSDTVTLSDILISNKNIECCSHIMKYFFKQINLESLVHCCKFITEFPFYNRYNYECINTLLYYKARNIKGFLNSLFPNLCCCFRPKKNRYRFLNNNSNINDVSFRKQIKLPEGIIPTNNDMIYEYIFENICLFIKAFLIYDRKKWVFVLFLFYIIFLCFFALFIKSKFSIYDFDITIIMLSYVKLLIGIFTLFKSKDSKDYFINERYKINDIENNILGTFSQVKKIEDIKKIPMSENEICEFCLTKKRKSTFHCIICNKCIKEYYFHSDIFNLCIHRNNIFFYILILFPIFILNSFIAFELGLKGIFFISMALITLGQLITLFICIGKNVTYHNVFNSHKIFSSNNIKLRNNNEYVTLLEINDGSLQNFYFNFIRRNNN